MSASDWAPGLPPTDRRAAFFRPAERESERNVRRLKGAPQLTSVAARCALAAGLTPLTAGPERPGLLCEGPGLLCEGPGLLCEVAVPGADGDVRSIHAHGDGAPLIVAGGNRPRRRVAEQVLVPELAGDCPHDG